MELKLVLDGMDQSKVPAIACFQEECTGYLVLADESASMRDTGIELESGLHLLGRLLRCYKCGAEAFLAYGAGD